MKKILLTIFLGTFEAMVFAAPALAATNISFTPVSINVRQGQSFTLTITINPQGVKNYTVKTELHYPADLLEVKSFSFANSWMPFSQPGYNLTDNTNGVFIKAAGYPGGASSTVTFGTVSFLAKKSGSGTIALKGNSFVLDANNQNVLAGASVQTAVAVSAPIKTTPKVPTTQKIPAVELTEEENVLREEMLIAPEPETASQPIAPQSLLAQIGGFMTLGTDSTIVGILVSAIILALIGYVIYTVIRRTQSKNSGDLPQ